MKKLNSLLPFVTFSAILVSVWHEWVFYLWFASSFVDLPQPVDYLSSALRWLPNILVIVVAASMGVLWGEKISLWIEKTLITWRSPSKYSSLKIATKTLLFFGGVPLTTFSYLLSPFRWTVLAPLIVMIAWFLVIDIIENRLDPKKFHLLVNFGVVVSFVLLWVAYFAVDNAERILRFDEGEYSLILEDGGAINNAVLVRNLSAGILVALPDDKNIRFIQWPEIRSVNVIREELIQENRLCEWIGYTCYSETMNVSHTSE